MEEDLILRVAKNIALFLIGAVSFPLLWVLLAGDYPGAAMFYGFEEDHDFVDFIFSIREFFTIK